MPLLMIAVHCVQSVWFCTTLPHTNRLTIHFHSPHLPLALLQTERISAELRQNESVAAVLEQLAAFFRNRR